MPLFFQIMFSRLQCKMPLFRLLLENYPLHLYKKLPPVFFKVYTSRRKPSLLCSQAPRHLLIKSLLCHRSRNVLSFRKVQWFMPLTERKNMKSKGLCIFQSVLIVLKTECGLLELWDNFALHKQSHLCPCTEK